MTIVFVSNFINHHQVGVADELYRKLGDNYHFIETMSMPKWLLDSGYPMIDRPYVVKSYVDFRLRQKSQKIIDEADVVVIGSSPEEFIQSRLKSGKIILRYNERWFKSRPWFLTGPRGWLNLYRNHLRYKNKPLYMLCASAFTAKDVNTVGAYKGKCFKWGYFTKVDSFEVETQEQGTSASKNTPNIMWCARFLRNKHPELPVKLAARLKSKGYEFVLNMFGCGEELENTQKLARKLKVDDVVRFCGNLPNDEILSQMRQHDIFLFTSDKNEGWGAVLNEAMSNGCAVVGSDKIGSVPFLIEDGVNGLIFKSENIDSLEAKVVELLDNPIRRNSLSYNARKTMREIWSPENAAKQFLLLVEGLTNNDESLIPTSGPASRV